MGFCAVELMKFYQVLPGRPSHPQKGSWFHSVCRWIRLCILEKNRTPFWRAGLSEITALLTEWGNAARGRSREVGVLRKRHKECLPFSLDSKRAKTCPEKSETILVSCFRREQFHGLGSLYCRGAAAVILTYDVSHRQSLLELEDRFLGLTDTASTDCLFAIVGNKVDLVEEGAAEGQEEDGPGPGTAGSGRSPKVPKLVQPEDAVALYRKILKYKMLDEKAVPAAEQMCFETSAKTGYNVDLLFETLFDMVVPMILRQRAQGPPQTVDISSHKTPRRTRSGCCA
ncbi:ras-related protein Rab-20 isoform X2 [Neovison vison]|uniref:ras-related protein Rab-20 isoform X2 n=1 Tax=Neovison vison TaxID=452646 RepID=UPI001CF0110D|nr:ras-related protein Rab-20 isoform X2 [Neogale vison]